MLVCAAFFSRNVGEHVKWTLPSDVGVKVYGLTDSDIKNDKDKEYYTIIIGYASLQKEQIEKGIETLKKAWNI